FPLHSIEFLLKSQNLKLSDIECFVYYEKPILKFERLLDTYLGSAPKGFLSFCEFVPKWFKETLFIERVFHKKLSSLKQYGPYKQLKLFYSEHHRSHASSAYFPSPFSKAIVICMDGVGEKETTTVWVARGTNLIKKRVIHYPDSLGLLYSSFTSYLGFKVNSDEYKVMGLAPYGVPQYEDLIFNHIIELFEDGSFVLNQSYFDFNAKLRMTSQNFHDLFGQEPRKSEDEITQFHKDVARSIQAVLEKVVLKIVDVACREFEIFDVCLAGGVALNCVVNGKILQETSCKNIWIQPAAGDAGGAIGAALLAWYDIYKGQRLPSIAGDSMQGSFLGPSYSEDSIKELLIRKRLPIQQFESIEEKAIAVADRIFQSQTVGWFEKALEFGPRALGHRSILGNPFDPEVREIINRKIKKRETFRPFAPALLVEDAPNLFATVHESPYMLLVDKVQPKSGLESASYMPATTHVDGTARIQTVQDDPGSGFAELLRVVKKRKGVGVVLNTSFNVAGEPIVCSPEEALQSAKAAQLDFLVLENFYLTGEQLQKVESPGHLSGKALVPFWSQVKPLLLFMVVMGWGFWIHSWVGLAVAASSYLILAAIYFFLRKQGILRITYFDILGRVNNMIVIALPYFLLLVPFSFITKVAGKPIPFERTSRWLKMSQTEEADTFDYTVQF
ncbi:MAG: hypothetical protein KDD61_15935, partial [Bdellovibrionales bacterium]|nr:hypothetical protein [Bdellovibrionales bacterium]